MEGDAPQVKEAKPFTTVFRRDFPYFRSLGMTYEEYWYGDPLLVRDYLQAEEYRRRQENYSLWMSGLYMREAIMASIGNAFIDKGQPPYEYPERPFPMTDEEIEAQREEQEKREVEQAEMYMKLLVEQGKDWGKKEPLGTPV